MDTASFGVKPGEHIPGEVINTYLKAYAEKFGIAGFIRLQTKVVVAEHQDTDEGGWILTVAKPKQADTRIYARRLIIASGLTSEAFLPHFAGQETFGGKIFHSKHFLQNSVTLKTAKSVTIFGGTKFAWDAVYSYATSGVKVNWVIRCAHPYIKPLILKSVTNNDYSLWPWPYLDCASVCYAAEEMDREARQYV